MKKIAIAALLAAFISTPVFAESETGFYIGIKVGQSDVGGNTTGYGAYGGYHIDKKVTSEIVGRSKFLDQVSFAVEGEHTILGSNSAGTSKWKASAIGFMLAGTYPFNPQFSVLAKAGLARTTNELSCPSACGAYNNSTLGLRIGAAGQFHLSEKIDLRAGYDEYPDGFSQLSAGAVFNF